MQRMYGIFGAVREKNPDKEFRPSSERFIIIHAFLKALAIEDITLPEGSPFITNRFHGRNEEGVMAHVVCYEYLGTDHVQTSISVTFWEEYDMLHFSTFTERPAMRVFIDKGTRTPFAVAHRGTNTTFAPADSGFHAADHACPGEVGISSSVDVFDASLLGLSPSGNLLEDAYVENLLLNAQAAVVQALRTESYSICEGFNDAERQIQDEHLRHLPAELSLALSDLSQATGIPPLADWARGNVQAAMQAIEIAPGPNVTKL